jgi:hypothetical protein
MRMNGSKLIPFVLIGFLLAFLALGLASAQTTTTTTTTSTSTSTSTMTTFTDSTETVHHAYNVSVSTLLPNAVTSATATVSSSTGVAPPHEEPHPEPDDYASDYSSYVDAGAIITTLAAALVIYKVPHPAKTSKVKQILD